MPPATVTTSPVTWPAARVGAQPRHGPRDVLGARDLAQRHRGGDSARRAASVSDASVIGDTVQPGRDDVDARRRELVLERQQQPLADRGLGGRVVGVAGLAEAAGGRADEDERAGSARPASPRAKPRAVRNVAVRLPSIVPASARAGARRPARPRSATRRRWRRTGRAARPARTARRPAPRRAGRRRARARRAPRAAARVAVVVRDDLDPLRRELARDGLADAARGARHERPLAREPEVHATGRPPRRRGCGRGRGGS